MKLFFLLLFFTGCGSISLKYNYASSDARIHCAKDCPGPECLCIMGSNNTWYLSPEVGDE